jgi:competence protein ComEC
MPRRKDLRLLAPAAAAWGVAWAAVAAPEVGVPAWVPAAGLWAVAAGTAAALVILGVVPGRRSVRLTPALAALLLAVSAGALVAHSAWVGADARSASPLAAAATSGDEVDVVVELTGAAVPMRSGFETPWGAPAEPRVGFDGMLVSVDASAARRIPVSAVGAHVDGLVFGARAAFTARVDRQPADEQAAYRLRATGEIDAAPPTGVLGSAAALRAGFAESAARLGGDCGALVPGLAIGDTSAVGAELDADMKVASLTHLTAVSGANCAIITALVFALAAGCGAPRPIRVLAALAALGGFVALVTPESSVVRAAAMAVVVLVATARGRPGGGVAALSLAVIALVVVNPWYSHDYGFALSVCATAGLLLLAGPLGARLARVMPRPIATALAVPLAAQLACQPVLLLLDPAIASYGVVANLLAAPAAPVATMVGLSGCLVLPLLPSVGFAALQVAAVPAEWIALVAHGVARLPVARIPWLADVGGALLLAAGTAAAVWLLLARRRPRGFAAAAAGVLLVSVAIPVGTAVGGPALRRAGIPRDWVVAACDIGQGDAVLLRSAGAVALIDTGPDDGALERCLRLTGVERVQLLVLTHWDLDHVGATGVLAGRVEAVIHGPLDGARSTRALAPLIEAGAAHHEVVTGAHGVLGASSWKVLWPPSGRAPGNDASVVLDVRAPELGGVFLGDLGETAQAELLRTARPPPVDLVKVAHHGSADQSAALYDRLAAEIGLIGVGADNGYGHPTDRTLDLLAEQGTAIVRTDLAGTALLTPERDGFRLWTERDVRSRPGRRRRSSGGQLAVSSARAGVRRSRTAAAKLRLRPSECAVTSCSPTRHSQPVPVVERTKP